MAQEDMNVTIPPEMMQEIVRVASETAIEKFQHEAERNRKAVKDKRLHNTKLLLQNYHCFVEHSKSAVYEASQLSEDDDFEELMEELMSQSDGRVRVPVVRSIQESAAHTRIIVQHIDRMLLAQNRPLIMNICTDLEKEKAKSLKTVQMTKYPEAKEMRGLMELTKKVPDKKMGYRLTYESPLYDRNAKQALNEWLGREERWQKQREKTKSAAQP